MAELTVGDLDEAVIRRLRLRAAQNGRSVEAEHRDILRSVLVRGGQAPTRGQVAERPAEFRRRATERGPASSAELLDEARTGHAQDSTRDPADIRD